MDIQQRLQQAVDNEMFLSGGERDLLVDALNEIISLRCQMEERYIAMRVRQLEEALRAARKDP